MAKTLPVCVAFALVATAVLPALPAHEGDPKLLRRTPAFRGRGLTTGAPSPQLLPGGSGPAYMSFANNGIRLMSWLSLQDLSGGDNGNSLWGYTSPSGREYACFGSQLGTHFVEVTDPSQPTVVGFVDGADSLWRDIRTYSHYAYAVSEGGGGIQVIDLANIDNGSVALANTVLVGGSTQATHTVEIDAVSGFLYRSGGGSHGIRAYSLANPLNPSFVGSWDVRYCHEVTVRTYTSGIYAGKQVAFLCSGYNGGWSGAGIDILDVTNKSNIVSLSHINYTGAQYSHQCWPTDDMQYLYLDDELDEYYGLTTTTTKVFDISDLTNPIQLPDFGNGNTAIGHNLYNKGNLHYQANYTSGLRVFDISNPLAPSEFAWFDTYPENDGNTFNSLWNVYVYFQSGTIIGSDIDRGLFVWWVGAPKVALAPASVPDVVQAAQQTIDVTLTEATAGDYQTGTAELHVHTASGGWQSSALTALGGNNYRATFPNVACGEAVQWYLSAQSTDGFTWTEPAGAPGVTNIATSAFSVTNVANFDFETTGGWTAGAAGDTASAGTWLRGDPHSTTSAQSEDDHTDASYQCWYTGDNADVDGGRTSLVSPLFNLTAAHDPHVRYWRWFSNHTGANPNTDVFRAQISNNGGTTWSDVETVGPTGQAANGGWYLHQFRVADFVAPTAQVRVKFIVEDLGGDSEIEAALDDFAVFEVMCGSTGAVYCSAKLNSQGCLPSISATGLASVSSAAPFTITANNLINQRSGMLIYGYGSAALPFQGGTKCITSPTLRTPLQLTGGSIGPDDCSGALAFAMNAWIQSGADANLIAGASVFTQFWSRDGADPAGFGTSLSNGFSFSIDL